MGDWGAIPDWLTAAAAVVALGVSIYGIVESRKAADLAERSAKAAELSAASEATSAEAAERYAKAAEASATEAKRLNELEARRRRELRAHVTLRYDGGRPVTLISDGQIPATEVKLFDAHDVLPRMPQWHEPGFQQAVEQMSAFLGGARPPAPIARPVEEIVPHTTAGVTTYLDLPDWITEVTVVWSDENVAYSGEVYAIRA